MQLIPFLERTYRASLTAIHYNGDYLGNWGVPSPAQRSHLLIRQLELGEEGLSNLSSQLQPVTAKGKTTNTVIFSSV